MNEQLVQWLVGGGGIASVAAAINWVYSNLTKKMEAREDDIKEREHALEQRIATERATLEARVESLEGIIRTITDSLSAHRSALILLVAKVMRDDPNAPELRIVEGLVGMTVEKVIEAGDAK